MSMKNIDAFGLGFYIINDEKRKEELNKLQGTQTFSDENGNEFFLITMIPKSRVVNKNGEIDYDKLSNNIPLNVPFEQKIELAKTRKLSLSGVYYAITDCSYKINDVDQ